MNTQVYPSYPSRQSEPDLVRKLRKVQNKAALRQTGSNHEVDLSCEPLHQCINVYPSYLFIDLSSS